MAYYHFRKDSGISITVDSQEANSGLTDQLPLGTQFSEPDDRFPGSFFRIPGVPSLGKTTWSLVE